MSDKNKVKAELQIQTFLRKGHTIEELAAKYKIVTKPHPYFPHLILFKYDQHGSPFQHEIVRECRGLILDNSKDWKVVCYPYFKFFNQGEQFAATVDWNTARVYEKLDGSLATLYWYGNKWNVASSGSPAATGELGCKLKFDELFRDIWTKMKYRYPKDRNKCYMFEMLTPRNQILCVPTAEEIIFHGARELQTLKELNPDEVGAANGWKVVKSYPMKNLGDVIEAAKKLNPAVAEGYVVCDAAFNRLKIKSPSYVALAHLATKDLNGFNYKHMLDIVRTNEGDEFLAYFPEWRGLYNKVKDQYLKLAVMIETELNKVKGSKNWKPDLEELLAKHPHSKIYVDIESEIRGGQAKSVTDFLETCPLDTIWTLTEFIRGKGRHPASKSAAAAAELADEAEEEKMQVEEEPEAPKGKRGGPKPQTKNGLQVKKAGKGKGIDVGPFTVEYAPGLKEYEPPKKHHGRG